MRFSPGCGCCGAGEVGSCTDCVGSPIPATLYLTVAGAGGVCAALNGTHALSHTAGFNWFGQIDPGPVCNGGTSHDARVSCVNDGSGNAVFSLTFFHNPGLNSFAIALLDVDSCAPLELSGSGDLSGAFCDGLCLLSATYTVTE